jgi:hypothetical protein
MATLKLPDGRTITFPDGLAPDQVKKIVDAAKAAPQAQAAPEGNPDRWGAAYQAADTVTMGGSTKLGAAGQALLDAGLGAVQGNGWDFSGAYDRNLGQARADQQAYATENPVRSGLGTAGGVALGVTSLPTIGKGFKGAVATGGAYGSAGGALRDADSWQDRALNTGVGLVTGGLLGGGIYGVSKGVASLLGNKKNAPPTAAEWKDKAQKLYSDAEGGFGKTEMAVDDVLKLADDFEKVAGKAEQNSPFAPIASKPYKETLSTIQEFRQIAADIAAGNKTQPNYAQLERLRQSIRDMSGDMVRPDGRSTQDGRLMGRLLDAVDNMLLNSPFEEARAAYATYIKSDRMAQAFKAAERTAGTNYTQAGMERAIQGEFKRMAANKNFERMFTPEEQQMILNVVQPGGVQLLMKRFGALAPKGGMSTMFNIGMTTMNPLLGVPLGVGATAANIGSRQQTMNAARAADAFVRSQGAPPSEGQLVDQMRRVLLPPAALLGDAYLRTEQGGPR